MWRPNTIPSSTLMLNIASDFGMNVYMVVFLFNIVICVFLLLGVCILIVCLCIFIVPSGTLRLPWLRFLRAFSSVVRQMPGYSSQRRGTARTLPKKFVLFYVLFVLCRSVYCLCVNVYCITATGWQPNCSLTNISYIKYSGVNLNLKMVSHAVRLRRANFCNN
jgi:hypothetical protein